MDSLCREDKKRILKTIHLLRVESIATALHEEFLISREVTIKVQDLTNELKKIQNMDTVEQTENFAKKRFLYEKEKEMETTEGITYKRPKLTA